MAWLSVWSEVQTCICFSWCHCHSLSLASMKSRLVLPFLVQAHLGSPGKRAVKLMCVCVSGTTRVGWYQKKHSPTHTHPDHQTPFINSLHLLRSIASSLFNLRAWLSLSTTSLQVLFDSLTVNHIIPSNLLSNSMFLKYLYESSIGFCSRCLMLTAKRKLHFVLQMKHSYMELSACKSSKLYCWVHWSHLFFIRTETRN